MTLFSTPGTCMMYKLPICFNNVGSQYASRRHVLQNPPELLLLLALLLHSDYEHLADGWYVTWDISSCI